MCDVAARYPGGSKPTISRFVATGSKSPPKRSCNASCLEADSDAWKVALYFCTVSESTPGEATMTPSFCVSRHFTASQLLRRKDSKETGVLDLRNLGGPRMMGVCSDRHSRSSSMS